MQRVEVELTVPEGHRLCDFLERLRGPLKSAACADSLADLEEQIGDATAAASWLRENVRFDLDSPQRQDLLDALSGPADGEDLDDQLALAEIHQKLLVAGAR